MSTRRGPRISGKGRFVWGGLVVLLLGALAATFFLSRGAITSAEADAQTRAADWVGKLLFASLTPDQLAEPLPEAEYRRLLLTLQSGVLSDERAVRVRIWNPDRTLVFSTDQVDEVGKVVAADDPQLTSALGGTTTSIVTPPHVAASGGLGGTEERLYETSVPLRLQGSTGISGVAQIDQRYMAIESDAASPWRTIRIGLVLVLTAAAIMFVASLRPRVVEVAADSGEPAAEAASRPTRQDRKAAERAAKAEESARAAKERLAQAEADAAAQQAAADEALVRVRELEERVTLAEERAAKAEDSLRAAAERAAGGEPVRRGVPGVGAVATAGEGSRPTEELRQARAELEELTLKLSYAEASAQEAKAVLTEREATAAQIEQAWRAADRELGEARTRLASMETELAAAREARAMDGSDGVRMESSDAAVEEQVAAARAQAEAEAHRAQAMEARLRELEAELAEVVAAGEAVAGELEAARAERAERQAAPAVERATGEPDELQARIEELEAQRRSDISEIQRAQEALVNTQLEARKAHERAKELEERLRQIESDSAVASAAGALGDGAAEVAAADELARFLGAQPLGFEREEATSSEEPGETIAARLEGLRRQNGNGRTPLGDTADAAEALETADRPSEATSETAPEPPGPEDQVTVGEEGLSLRERLSRAAAARHRAPGTAGPDDG